MEPESSDGEPPQAPQGTGSVETQATQHNWQIDMMLGDAQPESDGPAGSTAGSAGPSVPPETDREGGRGEEQHGPPFNSTSKRP